MNELEPHYCWRCLKTHTSRHWIEQEDNEDVGLFCVTNKELPWMLKLFEPNASEDYPS